MYAGPPALLVHCAVLYIVCVFDIAFPAPNSGAGPDGRSVTSKARISLRYLCKGDALHPSIMSFSKSGLFKDPSCRATTIPSLATWPLCSTMQHPGSTYRTMYHCLVSPDSPIPELECSIKGQALESICPFIPCPCCPISKYLPSAEFTMLEPEPFHTFSSSRTARCFPRLLTVK